MENFGIWRFFAHLVFVGFVIALPSGSRVVSSELGALMYLQKYGYLDTPSSSLSSMVSMSTAIREFQSFAGLPETGELDRLTLAKMNSPRCGVPDKMKNWEPRNHLRQKRYALVGSKWTENTLKYRIAEYPQRRLHDRWQVDRAVEKAFQMWSEVTNLTFVRSENGPVHIKIQFVEGDHGDEEPFDGPGNALAHAFPPDHGEIHFDDTENWTLNDWEGEDFHQLATHEIGHALGLFHSEEPYSTMTPIYFFRTNFRLHEDDIRGIQDLYGKREHPLKVPPHPGAPDLCGSLAIQAVTTTGDGRTYFFKGDYYWEIGKEKTSKILPGYPRPISDDWDGLPGHIDAAFTWPNGDTYVFKGHQYWKFKNKNMYPGYPKDISHRFPGIPNDVDAAFFWRGKTYFFKGSQYWKYEHDKNPRVHPKYPISIKKRWTGIPTHISAAFQRGNEKVYFFKADQYFEFNDGVLKNGVPVKPGYAQSIAKWLNC